MPCHVDDVDRPSFDLILDLEASHIVLKISSSLSYDPKFDSDKFDQLGEFAQLYHSGSKIRFNNFIQPSISISSFVLDRHKILIKPSRAISSPYICPNKNGVSVIYGRIKLKFTLLLNM